MKLFVVYSSTEEYDINIPAGDPIIICTSIKQVKKWFEAQKTHEKILVVEYITNEVKDWNEPNTEHILTAKDIKYTAYNQFRTTSSSQ
jgi:hypothetical protein